MDVCRTPDERSDAMSLSMALRSRVLRLYPSSWRARYGDEFAALLEEYPLTPFALFDIVVGALDAHLTPFDANGRILRMLNQPRRSVIAVFIAYIAFVLAGINYNRMIEDDLRTINPAHPAVAAAYNAVAWASAVSLLAVLIGGLPIGFAIARRALAGRRWDILALLAVPPLALLIWLGWTWVLLNAIAPQVDSGAIPRPTAGLFFLTWTGVFLLAAIASTAAVSIAVSRSEVPARIYRFALGPAAVAVLTMLVMFVAVFAWGLLIQAQVPGYLGHLDGPPPYQVPILAGWVVDLIVMALATLIAGAALIRAWRTPSPPAETVPSVGAA
jgi:hypothetical protein